MRLRDGLMRTNIVYRASYSRQINTLDRGPETNVDREKNKMQGAVSTVLHDVRYSLRTLANRPAAARCEYHADGSAARAMTAMLVVYATVTMGP